MPKLVKYSKLKVLKITETQFLTLKKLAFYKINTCQFIRDAIAEKIERDCDALLPKPKKEYCPF